LRPSPAARSAPTPTIGRTGASRSAGRARTLFRSDLTKRLATAWTEMRRFESAGWPTRSDVRGPLPKLAAVTENETTGRYQPEEIRGKWQLVWEAENTWVVPKPGSPEFDESRPKSYVLEMLPYPSGEPHVGHLKTYSVGDAIAHFRRRRGFRVVHPMGYDAFGLPAENNA